MTPQIEISKSYNLKLIADSYNKLSDYEKFKKNKRECLLNIYKNCIESAKRGSYSYGTFVTYRYDDPEKEFMIQYWKDLGYETELYEPGLIKGEKNEPSEEELKTAPYRYYTLIISWK